MWTLQQCVHQLVVRDERQLENAAGIGGSMLQKMYIVYYCI